MSDNNVNNVNNTPEPQPSYENFNQYPQSTPVQPIYVASAGFNPDNERKAKTLGIWSIVLSVISPCCCGITALVGLALAISGLAKSKGNILCIIALILSALALVFYAIYFFNVGQMVNDPEFMEQYMQQYNEMLQQMQQAQQAAPSGSVLRGIFH